MKKFISMFGVSTLSLLLIPAATLACECPPVPINQTAEQAKAAFLREVEDASVIFFGEVIESGLLEARFKVEKVWKGNLKDEVIILTGVKMHEDGGYSRSSCDYGGYRAGRMYVVWASGPADSLKAHNCSRTRFREGAEQDMEALDALKANGSESLKAKPRSKLDTPGEGEI